MGSKNPCPNIFCADRKTPCGTCLSEVNTDIFCYFREKYLEHTSQVESLQKDLYLFGKILRSRMPPPLRGQNKIAAVLDDKW
jgi:hypothetical protein